MIHFVDVNWHSAMIFISLEEYKGRIVHKYDYCIDGQKFWERKTFNVISV